MRRLTENPGTDNSASHQGGSLRGSDKWPDLVCILKIESTGVADGLGVRDERRGTLDASKELGLKHPGAWVAWYSLSSQGPGQTLR